MLSLNIIYMKNFDLNLNRGLYLKADAHHELAEPHVTLDNDGS